MLFDSIDASYYRSECNLIYGTTYEGALSLAHMENRAHGVRHRSPEPAGQRCVPLCFPVRYYVYSYRLRPASVMFTIKFSLR